MSLFNAKELQRYSVTKALAELSASPEPGIDGIVTGLEAECSEALKSQARRLTDSVPIGFQIPLAALAPVGKAMNVTTALSGGFLVGEDLEAIVPALRSASVVLALGAQTFANLKGDC